MVTNFSVQTSIIKSQREETRDLKKKLSQENPDAELEKAGKVIKILNAMGDSDKKTQLPKKEEDVE
ncbi:hypothetical protein GOV10_01835 [Candidatus Woesearchaeota archaeon]|nr:hypothetical protein [Candidatus Woesearchaeota archaeon]